MLLVIADDFSGAAEIAGAAHALGLHTEVQTILRASSAECIVVDTNTRGQDAAFATQQIADLVSQIRSLQPSWLYKKTDSVLRGPVAAELWAIIRQWPFARVLLIPSNPSRGRTMVGGTILISGIPVAQTHFAVDPEHPARSSHALEILGLTNDSQVLSSSEPFSQSQFIVGNAETQDDLDQWAARVDQQTLPAGGVEFFQSLLRWKAGHQFNYRAGVHNNSPFVGRTLLVCGTSTGWSERIVRLRHHKIPLIEMTSIGINRCATADELRCLAAQTIQQLSSHRVVAVAVHAERLPESECKNYGAENLAKLVHKVLQTYVLNSLIVEGGATASAIVRACQWNALTALEQIAQGVVSLKPAGDSFPTITVKPGSYPWPDFIWSTCTNLNETSE